MGRGYNTKAGDYGKHATIVTYFLEMVNSGLLEEHVHIGTGQVSSLKNCYMGRDGLGYITYFD